MSQHFLKFFHAPTGCVVRVQHGWDRPLQGFYLVVQKDDQTALPDDDEGILYSNLFCVGHPPDQGYYREVAKQLGLPIPEEIWRAAYLDSQHNVVNKQAFYNAAGQLIEPF